MATLVMFLTFGAVLWIYSDMSYLSKDVLRQFAVTAVLTAGLGFGFFFLVVKSATMPHYFYFAFIPFFVVGIMQLYKRRKIIPLSVIANQQRYWSEIKGSDVYKFFLGRKERKRKKIVIRVNEGEKKFFQTSEFAPDKDYVNVGFFKTMKRIESEFSFVKTPENTDDKAILKALEEVINKSRLYKAIFDKVKDFIKEQDIDVDFVEILAENKNCVEFFLLDIWERYTKRVNIGTANLVLLADKEIEEEFIGALDNIDLYSVKAKGAALYYRYMLFKDRVKNYIKAPENEPKEDAKLKELDEEFNDGDYL